MTSSRTSSRPATSRAAVRAAAVAAAVGIASGIFIPSAGAAVPERYPLGSIHTLGRTSVDGARIVGRAADPDRPALPVLVKFSVDGRHLATVSANRGDGHAFEANLSIDAASHEVCVTAVGRGPSQLARTIGCARVGAYQPPAAPAQPSPANTPANTPTPNTPAPVAPPSAAKPKPAPTTTPKPKLGCNPNVLLFMPQSMRMVFPPRNTCFKWARTNMGFANDLGLRNDFTFSDNWGVVAPLPHETRGVSWTIEDVNTAIPARTPSQVASVNANYGKPDSPLGFMQLAVRSRVTTHLDQLGVRAHFIPTVQVYESATGGIATRRSLDYARSQKAKGVLPIFNITPQNLNAATIATIRKECINFNGRIGVWSGTGAYPKTQPALNEAIESMTPKVQALYRAIDSCNQVIGRRSAPSPGL